ncbi:MAG: TonB family protein [Enterobacterales bacterium]|jgi:TonB family protein
MNKLIGIVFLITMVVFCCPIYAAKPSDVMQVIRMVEEFHPKKVEGTFVLTIKATGVRKTKQGKPASLLNTELDYRDRRNLTIAISPKANSFLSQKFGTSPDKYFLNKTIEVTGTAKREVIWFYANKKRTNKYYHQIHIQVTHPDQIKVVNSQQLSVLDISNDSLVDNVNKNYADAVVVKKAKARWPKKALQERIEGSVRLCFTVMPNGMVKNIVVKQSNPNKLFVGSSQRAIQKFRFKPTVVDGVAIEQDNMCHTIDFTLKN